MRMVQRQAPGNGDEPSLWGYGSRPQVRDQDRHEVKSPENSAGDSYTWGLDLTNTLQGAGGVGGLLMEGNRYCLYDANGNITQKLGTTGTLDMAAEYGPFGEVVSGAIVGEYGFSTKFLDAKTGMYDYGLRWYNVDFGRWLNRDPVGELFSLNLYGFIYNNPIVYVDILGLVQNGFTSGNGFMGHIPGQSYAPTPPSENIPAEPSFDTDIIRDAATTVGLGPVGVVATLPVKALDRTLDDDVQTDGLCLGEGLTKTESETNKCYRVCEHNVTGNVVVTKGTYQRNAIYRCKGTFYGFAGVWNLIDSEVTRACNAGKCKECYSTVNFIPNESASN